jgi:hypothetical protein
MLHTYKYREQKEGEPWSTTRKWTVIMTVVVRVGCEALLSYLHDVYGDSTLRRLRSLYDRPFSRYRNVLTLALALVHKEFDVNRAPFPPLHVAVLRPNSNLIAAILLWVRPEIQDRQYTTVMAANEEEVTFSPLPHCSTAVFSRK